LGLNNLGQVVGYLYGGYATQHAFVTVTDEVTDLNDLIDPRSGWELTVATGVNDSGKIVGYGWIGGNQRAFLATPTDAALPPSIPHNLIATGGHDHITLTWDDSERATSYHVKRSLRANGPFATIATVSSPSYSDTHVRRRVGYYYVVSAANSVGESPNSLPVFATP